MTTRRSRREYERDIRPDTAWRRARRTGYRTDPARHATARQKVPKARRVAIARLAAKAAAAARKKAR